MSTHWIGSPKSITGRGWMKHRPARAKITVVLLETLMSILHSTTVEGRWGMTQVADEQRRLTGRGYDGRVIGVEG